MQEPTRKSQIDIVVEQGGAAPHKATVPPGGKRGWAQNSRRGMSQWTQGLGVTAPVPHIFHARTFDPFVDSPFSRALSRARFGYGCSREVSSAAVAEPS